MDVQKLSKLIDSNRAIPDAGPLIASNRGGAANRGLEPGAVAGPINKTKPCLKIRYEIGSR
jgi:hypothetical protein